MLTPVLSLHCHCLIQKLLKAHFFLHMIRRRKISKKLLVYFAFSFILHFVELSALQRFSFEYEISSNIYKIPLKNISIGKVVSCLLGLGPSSCSVITVYSVMLISLFLNPYFIVSSLVSSFAVSCCSVFGCTCFTLILKK